MSSKPHRSARIAREAITGKEVSRHALVHLGSLRPAIADMIRNDHPGLADDALIALQTVNRYRGRYVEQLLRTERGAFSELDAEIVRAIADQEMMVENVEKDYARTLSLGDHAADLLARFGGSWAFLITFAAFITFWMILNHAGGKEAYDPFPFILLNLLLSTLAAVQAPIIMMSQRRQEERDRMRARSDYQVNLKAELEIRMLHEKIDHLIQREWDRLAEARSVQMELLDAIEKRPGQT
ncbi:DUF1003 domain-containing protein [Sandaracinobacteroides sp. A072]|uniref:DUF1003 domain-containing protein n=1 Tax=Sandaracinobacteroides sp. A072 TaxID=3461146 RepID=UPI0040422C57